MSQKRFKVTQRMLVGSDGLTWVVLDTSSGKTVSTGSFSSCAAACRELNQKIAPDSRLSQKQIDGKGEHRSRFFAMLSQIRNAVFPSTQIVK